MKQISRPALTVVAGMLVYVAILSTACHAKYHGFAYGDFDLAIDAQSTWNIVHGSVFSSLLGILGNHMRLILFLVAPLYALLPSALVLLHLQTLALAAGAWLVFLLAKEDLRPSWSVAMALVYLVYAPLVTMNLYEFHPVAPATAFLLGTALCYRRRQFGFFCLFMALAMLCQENIGLIAAGFGIYALVQRRGGRWVWIPLAAGVIVFPLTVFWIMPRLNPDMIQFTRLYEHLGESPADILATLITQPQRTMGVMLTAPKMAFVNSLLAPAGYLSLLSPSGLLPAAPVLLQRLLSGRASEASTAYHYQAEFIPFIFLSAIHGAKRLLAVRRINGRLILGLLIVLFPLTGLIATGIPSALTRAIAGSKHDRMTAAVKRDIVRSVPADARVLATFSFLPQLSNRRGLYSLHHVYTGRYTLSDVPYPTPDVDLVILDTHDRLTFSGAGFYAPENYGRLQKLLESPDWKIVTNVDGILVFAPSIGEESREAVRLVEYLDAEIDRDSSHRGGPQAQSRPRAAPVPAVPGGSAWHASVFPTKSSGARRVVQADDVPLELLAFELGKRDESGVADLLLYWRWSRDTARKDYGARIGISDGAGDLFSGVVFPGSRIRPPQSWPGDNIVRDRHRIRLAREPNPADDLTLQADLVAADQWTDM